MASIDGETLLQIKKYVGGIEGLQSDPMDIDDTKYSTRLDKTIRELQDRVQQQQELLEQLRVKSASSIPTVPSLHPRERLRQLRTLKTAYSYLASTPSLLPSSFSLVPSLLATRITQHNTLSTATAATDAQAQLSHANVLLTREQANLSDANLLTTALNDRLGSLQKQQVEKTKKTASQVARELLREKQKKKTRYQRESKMLSQALDVFIDRTLAGMLAAEEMGGPVVGDLMDVDETMLAGGFSSLGKPKINATREHGQRPITEFTTSTRGKSRQKSSDNNAPEERSASASEVRDLIDTLIDALYGESSQGTYIQLERDSAAARFLVRVKVAQFHPKDAKRLRLVDFGRELDD